jgi:hypothetical protein
MRWKAVLEAVCWAERRGMRSDARSRSKEMPSELNSAPTQRMVMLANRWGFLGS